MRNSSSQIFISLLILSTFSNQIESNTRTRIFRGIGIRGRRTDNGNGGGYINNGQPEGMNINAAGGYGSREQPKVPVLYSAPKINPAEPTTIAVRTGGMVEEQTNESLEQATTTELNSVEVKSADETQEILEQDFISDSSTQLPDSTETGSSPIPSLDGENEIDTRQGSTTEQQVDNEEVTSGGYSTPKVQEQQNASNGNGNNGQGVAENLIPQGRQSYKSSNNNNNYDDSSAAFSSYYSPPTSSSTSRARRPLDQQQVENFNYQQYSPQQRQSNVGGGYGPPQQPNFEQIAAIEKNYYSTSSNQNSNQGGGYQNPQNRQQENGYLIQQPRQQYVPQPQQQLQHRYIAQQPEQFYPTPALPPSEFQQQLPTNPTLSNGQRNSNDGYFNYPSQPTTTFVPQRPEPRTDTAQVDNTEGYNNLATTQPNFPINGQNDQNSELARQGTAATDNSILDEMNFTLEGLNDNVVDAELLERVQQIIEEHERQQKEFLEKQRSNAQNGIENLDQPINNEIQGSSRIQIEGPPKPSINYQLQGIPNKNEQLGRNQPKVNGNSGLGGYNYNSRQDPFVGKQQPQRYPQFNDQRESGQALIPQVRNGNSQIQGKSLQSRKYAKIDVQPAILTQHFVESGTRTNLQRQNIIEPQYNQQQQQIQQPESRNVYLPPRRQQIEPNPAFSQNIKVNNVPQFQEQFSQVRQQQQQSQGFPQQGQLNQGYGRQQSQPHQEYIFPNQLNALQATPNNDLKQGSSRLAQNPASGYQQVRNGGDGINYEQQQQQQPSENRINGGRGFTQQFRQEYSRLAQEPQQVELQPSPDAYPNYEYPGDSNSVEDGGYEQGQQAHLTPNVITKTIVIHEQPVATDFPGMTNRAIITADDLRSRVEIPSQPQQNEQPQQYSQNQQLPQQLQFIMATSKLAVQDQAGNNNMVYYPLSQYPEENQIILQNANHPMPPKPIYGIPLGPVLGPESLAAQPSEYVQPLQQYFIGRSSSPVQSSQQYGATNIEVQEPVSAQSAWDATLRAVYRLPQADLAENDPEDNTIINNPIQLVTKVVSSPSSGYQPSSTVSSSTSSETPSSSSESESSSETSSTSYGARIIDSRSIRKRFSQAMSSPLAGFYSVRKAKPVA